MSWYWMVERRLQEAFSEGLFDHLPGVGKPLRWDDESLVPPSWRAAFHLLRESGLAPAWVMIDVEIRKDLAEARLAFAQAAACLDQCDLEYAQSVDRFVCDLAKINTAIDELNCQVPSARMARARLNPEREIERIRRVGIGPGTRTTDGR